MRTENEINFSIYRANIFKDICPYCGGTGKVKAMQRMAFIGGGSMRGPDTYVECSACRGTGKRQL